MATWKLTNPTCVTNNAANERKAIEILGWERAGCYRHCINLIVKNALEVTEVNKILSKYRKLVGLHKSLIGHKLIIDCLTKSNFLQYYERFCKNEGKNM